MSKRQRKIVSVAVALSLAVAMGAGLTSKPVEAANSYGISNPVTDSNGVITWDKVKFGSYYQTAEFQTEPIKWRVLSVDGDDAFLLADENLDCKPYNTEDKAVTWETCSLRKWLNEDFYNEAFSDSEQAAIRETVVVNEDNPIYGTEGGNDTTDRIYLLSLSEAGNPNYGFVSDFFNATKTRESKSTDYVKCKDAEISDDGSGLWWLRSPGDFSGSAFNINYHGNVHSCGFKVGYDVVAVRPALHLNLSSSVHVDAGEVDSEGNVTNKNDGINAPTTDSDGVTTWDCVYLGNYKQKAVWKKEPIEWRVLSVDGDDAFLLADKCLDCMPYNTKEEDVTWETCSVRKWLNEDFYNEAFDSNEQMAIRETTVITKDNPEYETPGGNDTMDRIYCLSLDEVENADYGLVSKYARASKNTDYVKCINARNLDGGKGDWWLRSPGAYKDYAIYVDCWGCMFLFGRSANTDTSAVRPALHLNLSSSLWSEAGQVSEAPKPDITQDQTGITPNTPSVTASPVPTGNSADTGKLGKVSIKSAKNSKKRAAVLKWKKVNGVSGYQIQYALDKKFAKGRKTKTTAGTSYTLKKLKKKKMYYVRIRAFQKTGSKKVYGAWSKVKKVKIKK